MEDPCIQLYALSIQLVVSMSDCFNTLLQGKCRSTYYLLINFAYLLLFFKFVLPEVLPSSDNTLNSKVNVERQYFDDGKAINKRSRSTEQEVQKFVREVKPLLCNSWLSVGRVYFCY